MNPVTLLENFSPVDRNGIQETKPKWWNITCLVGDCSSFVDYCNFTNKPNSHAFEVETHTRRIHDKNYAILAAMLRNRRYFV